MNQHLAQTSELASLIEEYGAEAVLAATTQLLDSSRSDQSLPAYEDFAKQFAS